MCAGKFMSSRRINIETFARLKYFVMYVIFLLFFIYATYNSVIDRNSFYYVPIISQKIYNVSLRVIIPVLLLAFLGSFSILWVACIINSSKVLEYLGRNSIIVYCCHAFYSVLLLRWSWICPNVICSILYVVLCVICSLLLCCMTAYLLNQKYTRFLIGKFPR